MPDREITLFPSRSRARTSTSRFTIASCVPALVLAAIAAGSGLTASATAHPIGQIPPIGQAHHSSLTAEPVVSATAFAAAISAQHAIASVGSASTGAGGGVSTLAARTVVTASARSGPSRNRLIAWRMMRRRFGWRPHRQFGSLNRLWDRESGWHVYASNSYSGAYGIPQAVPGSKMATAGANWRSSARTQILWGLRYIKERYGTPRQAWDHEISYGWY